MYKLTKRRETKALPILEEAYQSLVTRGGFDVWRFERDLRACWNIGYHELYDVLEDAFKDDRWLYVAVYYMERVMPMLTSELQHALSIAYGIPKRGAGKDWDTYRNEFWKKSGIVTKD